MQTNSPHVLNVSASALQYAQRNRNHRQAHHPGHVKALFEIKNKRAAGPHQERDQQQRYHPEHIHSCSARGTHRQRQHTRSFFWGGGWGSQLRCERDRKHRDPDTHYTVRGGPSGHPGDASASVRLPPPKKMNMQRCSSVAKWHHEVESSRHRVFFFFLFPVAGPFKSDVTSDTLTVMSVHVYFKACMGFKKIHINCQTSI